MRRLLALAVSLLLAGCAGQTGSVSDLLHPTPDGVWRCLSGCGAQESNQR